MSPIRRPDDPRDPKLGWGGYRPPPKKKPSGRPDPFRVDPGLLQMDAAMECKHGRLAHDLDEPCGCWPGEKTDKTGEWLPESVLALITKEKKP